MNSEFKLISEEINSNISKYIKIAIESNSIESFYKIDSFCLKILRLSIQNKDINTYRQYLQFVNNYYLLSYIDTIKKNKKTKEINEICNDRSSRRIKETFFVLNIFYDRSNLEEKKHYNFFKLSTFTAFSQLLFEAVERNDINFFNDTLNQIENVFLGKRTNLTYFIYSYVDEKTYEDLQEVIYFRHLIIGIKYWIYNLYSNKQISIDEFKLFLESLNNLDTGNVFPEFWEMELLFNVLNTNAIDWYFNWQSWDFIKHKEGKFHSLPSVFEWIYNGYTIDVIQNRGFLLINNSKAYDIFKKKLTLTNKKLFVEKLKEGIENAKHQLNTGNQYIIEANIKNVEDELNLLSMKSEIDKAKDIVTSKLSNEKIQSFKEDFLNNWISSQIIRKIFDFYQNKISFDGEVGKLQLIGQNIFIEDAKLLFLDNEYNQNMLGPDRIGKQLSKWENDVFFQTVLNQKDEVLYPSYIQGIHETIIKLKQLKKSPSVLFISSITLLNELKKDENWKREIILDVFKGMYKNISVCSVNSSLLQNKFIICDFKNAFQMLYRKRDNNFNDYLDVKINEITDEVALEKLTENPTKWKNIEGISVSDEQALLNIKTSIIIDYEIVELFEILDFDALEIGIISDY